MTTQLVEIGADQDAYASDIAYAVEKQKSGNFAEAELIYRRILQADALHFDAMHMLGVLLFQQGKYQDGIATIIQALELHPDEAGALNNLGNMYRKLMRNDEAIECYERALADSDHDAAAYNNLGATLFEMDRCESAVAYFEKALAIDSDFADAHANLASCLFLQGRTAEAVAHCRTALSLNPESAQAHNTLASSLDLIGKYDEALQHVERALILEPMYAEAWSTKGIVEQRHNEHEKAIVSCERALAIKPDFADAHFGRAMSLLVLGKFAEGLKEYEWRLRQKSTGMQYPKLNAAKLTPDTLQLVKGKTVLVLDEQGVGDTFQFVRYLPRLTAMGAKVCFFTRAGVAALLESSLEVECVKLDGEQFSHFDFHCALLSLPFIFGTELKSIPSATPYLFADSSLAMRWKEKLREKRSNTAKLMVGIAWSGNPKHLNDRNRSISLSTLEPLFECADIHWVCLQNAISDRDKELLDRIRVVNFHGQDLKNFSETSALIDSVDLVISVDTSLAHLAGAMAKPVWLLLPFSPDWRWLLGTVRSPWYPSMRIFRQTKIGDWSSVLIEVRNELSKRMKRSWWKRALSGFAS